MPRERDGEVAADRLRDRSEQDGIGSVGAGAARLRPERRRTDVRLGGSAPARDAGRADPSSFVTSTGRVVLGRRPAVRDSSPKLAGSKARRYDRRRDRPPAAGPLTLSDLRDLGHRSRGRAEEAEASKSSVTTGSTSDLLPAVGSSTNERRWGTSGRGGPRPGAHSTTATTRTRKVSGHFVETGDEPGRLRVVFFNQGGARASGRPAGGALRSAVVQGLTDDDEPGRRPIGDRTAGSRGYPQSGAGLNTWESRGGSRLPRPPRTGHRRPGAESAARPHPRES